MSPEPPSQTVTSPPRPVRSGRLTRRWGSAFTILFGLVSLGFSVLLFWPLPTLADCREVSGRVSGVYTDRVTSGRNMTRERLNFTFLGHERYYSYEESDPKYEVVKSRLRSGVSARIWFKEPLTFIFPLYSKELWRIDMGEETIVGYDELAASAGWVKIVIALVGSILFGILTIVFALSTLRKSTA